MGNKRKSIKFIKDNKIICCNKENQSTLDESEINLLEKTVCDLENDGEIKNKFFDTLKKEHELFVEEAMRNEEDLNKLIEQQKQLISDLKEKLAIYTFDI